MRRAVEAWRLLVSRGALAAAAVELLQPEQSASRRALAAWRDEARRFRALEAAAAAARASQQLRGALQRWAFSSSWRRQGSAVRVWWLALQSAHVLAAWGAEAGLRRRAALAWRRAQAQALRRGIGGWQRAWRALAAEAARLAEVSLNSTRARLAQGSQLKPSRV